MYKKKTIGVVVPCYNEEKQIVKVIKTMPAFVDKIIVIDDKSQDKTVRLVSDYAKANRLISGKAYQKIPKTRYFGNSVLTFLTKIASGYWQVMDSQTGFTAI